MKVLIDTNVILDALLSRMPFHVHAQKLFLLAAEEKIQACITANSITDIYYLLKRHQKNHLSIQGTLRKLFLLFEIVDVTGADCQQALAIDMKDYEDALLAVCAKRANMAYILTRNLKDFDASPVPAIHPSEFLEKVR